MPFSGLSVMPLSVFKSLFCLTNRLSALCRNDSSTSKICLYLQVWNCIRIRIGSYNKCCVINVERKTGAHFSNRKKMSIDEILSLATCVATIFLSLTHCSDLMTHILSGLHRHWVCLCFCTSLWQFSLICVSM